MWELVVRRLWLHSRFSRSQFLYIITGCSLRRVVNHVSSECSSSHLSESVLCRHATFTILENFVAILYNFLHGAQSTVSEFITRRHSRGQQPTPFFAELIMGTLLSGLQITCSVIKLYFTFLRIPVCIKLK